MFSNIALTGVWLAGGLAVAVLVGMFVAQYVKDTFKGVPSPLRAALKQTETNALAALKAAEQKAIMDVTGLIPAAKTAAPATPATAAAPAAPAAPAAAVVQPAAK